MNSFIEQINACQTMDELNKLRDPLVEAGKKDSDLFFISQKAFRKKKAELQQGSVQ